jgi:hypothetical protein
MASVLSVKEWDRFQHYKDRDPPWIKLYRDTLTTEAWVLGNDVTRLVQLASTLLAARYSNQIPLKFDLIKKVASLDCDEAAFMAAVAHLVEHNFLEIHSVEDVRKQSASSPLATCNTQNESLYSEERRGEKSREEAEQIRHARANENSGEQKRELDPRATREAFERVKAAYPQFAGRQDWISAQRHCHCRLEEGETWNSLQAGVERYANHVRAKGSEGTQFVMSPAKFFSAADEPWKQPWTVPTNGATPKPLAKYKTADEVEDEIILRAIREGKSDEQIAAIEDLYIAPNLSQRIHAKRQELTREQH